MPPSNTASAVPMPVVIVGGYLGAGKTTLVNRQLRQARGRRIAVLVNDFGDINIDADLIQGSDGGVIALSGGCLCCSFGDDLVGTLTRLAQQTPAPDLCLIELSGVALPQVVARTARLALHTKLLGNLVVVDSGRVRSLSTDKYVGDTVQQQLRDAHWLWLNRTDAFTPEQVQTIAQFLSDNAPSASLFFDDADAAPIDAVLGQQQVIGDVPAQSTLQHKGFATRSLQARSWAHSKNSSFASRSISLPDGVDLHALGAALTQPQWGILRAKGYARDRQGRGQLLQLAGNRWEISDTAVQRSNCVVVIGTQQAMENLPSTYAELIQSIAWHPTPHV